MIPAAARSSEMARSTYAGQRVALRDLKNCWGETDLVAVVATIIQSSESTTACAL